MSGPSWRNPRILYTLVCVFLSGAVVGAMTMRFSFPRERHVTAGSPALKEGSTRDVLLKRFKKELDLTPEQTKQMEGVLDDYLSYYQSLQVQFEDWRATGKQRMLRVLRDDQKSRFEKLMLEYQGKHTR